MRKVKAFEIFAAAIAAVPSIAMADDVGAPANEVRTHQPRQIQSFTDHLTIGAGSRFRFASPLPGLNGGPDANVDGTFLNGVNDPGDGISWFNPANWTTNPNIPDGPTAIARFTELSGGVSITADGTAIVPITLNGNTVTLQRLDLNDPGNTILANGNIVLTGPAIIDARAFFDPPNVVFSGINQIGSATQSVSIGGTAGLNKTGSAPIQLNSPNSFSGPINITDGGKIIAAGGDAALGAAGNQVNLNNGTLEAFGVDLNTNRVINVGAGGGAIWYVGASRAATFAGDITGSGQLTTQGGFGANAATQGTFTGVKSFSGVLNADGGTLNIAGAIPNATAVINAGTVTLVASEASSVNRIGDTTPVTLKGSTLRVDTTGSAATYTEVMGNLNLDGSTGWVMAVRPGEGNLPTGTTLDFGNINRTSSATAHFRGLNLGQAPGPASTNIFFDNGTASLQGGIIPWAWGNDANAFSESPEGDNNTLVTYGPNGVTPITVYATDPNTSTPSDNLLISDAGGTITGTRNANALVLRVGDNFQGPAMTLGGNGVLNLSTGVVLSANSGILDTTGLPNSDPGNVVTANLNSGASQFVIMTPSALSLNGVLSGSGGLTKSGGRTAFFNGANTYTGETILSGFVRFGNDVIANAPGPFGNSSTPIILHGGNIAPQNPISGPQGTNAGILAAANFIGPTTFSRALTVRGTGTNLLRNFSDGPLTMSGGVTLEAGSDLLVQAFGAAGQGSDQFIFTAPITGPGHLSITDSQSGGATASSVTFLVPNTYTGGTAAGGTIILGADGAFGSGSMTLSESINFSTTGGGTRTVTNDMYAFGNNIGFHGTQPFNWNGRLDGGGQFVMNVTNTALTTINGQITGSAGIFKTGGGTLVLTGNNTFTDVLNVGNGTIEGGVVLLRNNNAAGLTVGNTGVNAGNNTIGLDSNVQIGNELLVLRGHGVGNLGALRSFSGNNTWGGTVLAGLPNTIGVDSGTLNLGKSWFSVAAAGTLAGTAIANKVGPGLLTVASETFTATRSNGATSSFQGSIIADGLAVNSGNLRIAPNTGTKRVVDVGTVTIGASSQLDLTNNVMVVDYASGGPSPLADIRSKIVSAYAGGTWTGPGITSSMADNTNFGLGYGEASGVLTYSTGTPPDALFEGDVVDQSAVLVRYTRYGDADLNGLVNLADFNRLAANFGIAAGAVWTQGDFDYNGNVNLSDFNRLAANFGQSAAGPEVTPQDWSNLASAVPEPGSLGLAAVAGLGLLKRRRRTAR